MKDEPFPAKTQPCERWFTGLRLSKKSQPDDMCVRLGHLQGNLAQRVCEAVRPSARFCVKFCPQGDIRDCGAEPLPAAETGEAEQGPRSVFCKGAATPAAKAGYRNQGISVTRMRAEMGSP